jgi:hypothetical protein
MLTVLLRRPARHAAFATGRIEVCPPPHGSSVWDRLARRLRAAAPQQADRLAAVRGEFCQSIADIHGPDAHDLTLRMRYARTLHELWHLRTELFNLVSLHHSQDEARCRLALLNRHFPCRAPRSAFAPLE